MKKLHEGGYLHTDISAGEILPVGGDLFHAGQRVSLSMIADTNNLDVIFADADQAFTEIKWENVPTLLDMTGLHLSGEFYGRMHALQAAITKGGYIGASIDDETRRTRKYIDGQPTLSEIFKDKCAQCMEIGVLAHTYLKRHGFESQMISGNVHWKHGDYFDEFNEPHVFLSIEQNGHRYIYDPANPVIPPNGKSYPSLYEVSPELYAAWEKRVETTRGFMRLTNVLSKQEALYGVSAPELSYLDRDIVTMTHPASKL